MTTAQYQKDYRNKHPEYIKNEVKRKTESRRLNSLKRFIDQTTNTQESQS